MCSDRMSLASAASLHEAEPTETVDAADQHWELDEQEEESPECEIADTCTPTEGNAHRER